MEESGKIQLKLDVEGELADAFRQVKILSGIKTNTEALRHCITTTHQHYQGRILTYTRTPDPRSTDASDVIRQRQTDASDDGDVWN